MKRIILPVVTFLGIIIGLSTGCSRSNDDSSGGFLSLFDGQSLDGWMIKCLPKDQDKDYWKIENGAIIADVPADSDHNYIWLLTEREYADFELRLKVQSFVDAKSNSGVQVRSRYDDETGWLDGPQIDINPPGGWRSGFIYDETRTVKAWISPIQGKPSAATIEDAVPGWSWQHGDEADLWNDVTIICDGARIKTIVNGITITDYDGAGILDDADHANLNVGMTGHIGLQIHPGGQGKIRFKDIRIKEL